MEIKVLKQKRYRRLYKRDFSFLENGKEIWFYIDGQGKFIVPSEYTESIRLTAVAEFKQKLKKFLDPSNVGEL